LSRPILWFAPCLFALLLVLAAAPLAADHCDPTEGHLCLQDGRFELSLEWRTGDGSSSGSGLAVPLSTDSGWFWFFSQANVEAMVKVLDGRAINGHFWVFFGALSDLELELRIDDLETGATRSYLAPPGAPAALRDLEAFLDAGSPDEASATTTTVPRRIASLHGVKEVDPEQDRIEGFVAHTHCASGGASGFPCLNVDLQSLVPLSAMTSRDGSTVTGNDVWGWTDPDTGREYALMGLSDGTSFVDVTSPTAPLVLGHMPTETQNTTWRDIKVYRNRAYVVADNALEHGMQVFDLRRLRGRGASSSGVVSLAPDAVYHGFGSAHNLAIDERSGFAYAVGTETCEGGLHIVDIRQPEQPAFAGCFGDDGYTHDAQCVTYTGPDGRYRNRRVCFAANEDTVTIVDVTDPAAPHMLSRTEYEGRSYTHQGWLTEDGRYFLVDDEGDERAFDHGTKTYIWDVRDLLQPSVIGVHESTSPAIDHNQYTHRGYVFQANYTSGLRILDLARVSQGLLEQVGYFDIVPEHDDRVFNGAWSVYPYLPSGNVLVSGMAQGLAVVRPLLPGFALPLPPGNLRAKVTGLSVELTWTNASQAQDAVRVYRRREGAGEELLVELAPGTGTLVDRGLEPVTEYRYRVVAVLGGVESEEQLVTVTTATEPSVCIAGATDHCLIGDRFAVAVAWRAPDGETGVAQTIPLTGDSGAFWFFDAGNAELVIKMADGRAINGHFWLFVGALSDVEYTITVTDTDNGRVRQYANPSGTLRSLADTSAFPGS
jgi:choice-of-anchor B domain-containing protein